MIRPLLISSSARRKHVYENPCNPDLNSLKGLFPTEQFYFNRTFHLFSYGTPNISLGTRFKGVRSFQVELEFGKGKPENPEKNLGVRTRINNKLNPHVTPSPRIEPRPHW